MDNRKLLKSNTPFANALIMAIGNQDLIPERVNRIMLTITDGVLEQSQPINFAMTKLMWPELHQFANFRVFENYAVTMQVEEFSGTQHLRIKLS